MPVLKVWEANKVIVFKRSMASGYAGVQNPLFFRENTAMLFGDAKTKVDEIVGLLARGTGLDRDGEGQARESAARPAMRGLTHRGHGNAFRK
jgi:hypothetical protein